MFSNCFPIYSIYFLMLCFITLCSHIHTLHTEKWMSIRGHNIWVTVYTSVIDSVPDDVWMVLDPQVTPGHLLKPGSVNYTTHVQARYRDALWLTVTEGRLCHMDDLPHFYSSTITAQLAGHCLTHSSSSGLYNRPGKPLPLEITLNSFLRKSLEAGRVWPF